MEDSDDGFDAMRKEPHILVIFDGKYTLDTGEVSNHVCFGVVPESYWKLYKEHVELYPIEYKLEDSKMTTHILHLDRNLDDKKIVELYQKLNDDQNRKSHHSDSSDLESHIEEKFGEYLEGQGMDWDYIIYDEYNTEWYEIWLGD